MDGPRISDMVELRDLRQFVLRRGEDEFRFQDPEIEETINAVVDAYSKDGVAIVKSLTGSAPDFTESSLIALEGFIASTANAISSDSKLASDTGLILTICHKLGAYVGQVARGALGGEWAIPARGDEPLKLVFANGSSCAPSALIFRRLSGESAVTLPAYLQELRRVAGS